MGNEKRKMVYIIDGGEVVGQLILGMFQAAWAYANLDDAFTAMGQQLPLAVLVSYESVLSQEDLISRVRGVTSASLFVVACEQLDRNSTLALQAMISAGHVTDVIQLPISKERIREIVMKAEAARALDARRAASAE